MRRSQGTVELAPTFALQDDGASAARWHIGNRFNSDIRMSVELIPAALQTLGSMRYARYRERAQIEGLSPLGLDALPGDALRVLACSGFVAAEIARQPQRFHALVESGDLERIYPGAAPVFAAPEATQDLRPIPAPELVTYFTVRLEAPELPTENEVLERLRVLRQREWLRLAWRDIGGLGTLPTMMAEASAFADAAVRFAATHAHRHLAARFGQPQGPAGEPQHLVVLGLGKLGAGELNFSSDIDLIFAYPQAGDTHGGARSLSNNEFFIRLARNVIKLLTHKTQTGSVFRVDMRLRPFGDSGPLVMSFDAMEDYYQHHGRDWERYALIRARPCAGDDDACEDLIERLFPFVYRRYLDFGTLELLRAMKRAMTEDANRRGLDANVKLGRGGIREVEFTAQAFQMVRGGRVSALRDRSLIRILPRLGELGYLPKFAVDALAQAYAFLRETENRLQEVDDRQTHDLPEDNAGRANLACAMGHANWEAFEGALDRHRELVHAQFAQVFGASEDEVEPVEEPLHALSSPELQPEEGVRLLAQAGFGDAAAAWQVLHEFLHAYDVRLLDSAGARRLQRVLPDLLRAAASQNAPSQTLQLQTLQRVIVVVQSIVRRSAYLSLLAERPLAMSQLAKLCSASPWIAHHLAGHPILLGELLDARELYQPMDRAGLGADLNVRMGNVEAGDTEQEMEVLRQFKNAAVLRVASADVGQQMPLMRVSDYLTETAEVALNRAMRIAWRDLSARHGEPRFESGGQAGVAPFAVIAYGKLGGIELSYTSDLDLVFVHGGPGGTLTTDGKRPIDAVVFFQRLGQRIIHFLSTATPSGIVYEVDSRLRPNGNKGPLVVRFEALEDYLHNEAWTWEHQALVRARAIAGDAQLCQRFSDLRLSVLRVPRNPKTLRNEVRSMRTRMRDALGSEAETGFDLKQDGGGIADIEFMVQYCALRWASELGDELRFTDNIRLLEGLAHKKLMAPADAQRLIDVYRDLRWAGHRQGLQAQANRVASDAYTKEREVVRSLWHRLIVDGTD